MNFLLTIISTLTETAFRWINRFWFLLLIVLVTDVPLDFITGLTNQHHVYPHPHRPDGFRTLLSLAGFPLLIFLPSAKIAAILGLLAFRSADRRSPWVMIGQSAVKYWWTLLLIDIAWGVFVVITFLVSFAIREHLTLFEDGTGAAIQFGFSSLVAGKFAIAAPLAVRENLNADKAIKTSWGVKGTTFWHAFCCLLFAHGLGAISNWILSPLRENLTEFTPGSHFVRACAGGLVGSFSVIVQWNIYLRLRGNQLAPTLGVPAIGASADGD